jgi:methionyl-tRNA formyltransferase
VTAWKEGVNLSFHDAKVLFCSKSNDENCEKALYFLTQNCSNVTVCVGDWGDDIPSEMLSWAGDFILSYMSKWIIPESVLKSASLGAINFHPGPPSHPGAAGANYALYDEDSEFGATCHHMEPKVDAGKIIMTKRFPILESDNVNSLLKRTHETLFEFFFEIVSILIEGKNLPVSAEKWDRTKFHTRSELNENLRRIPTDISKEELSRRIRATLFNEWKPYLVIHGVKFIMK